MGLFAFLLYVLVLVLVANLVVKLIHLFAPAAPEIISQMIWAIVALIIVLTLLRALGIGHDIPFPHL